jgi:hypothetical protein
VTEPLPPVETLDAPPDGETPAEHKPRPRSARIVSASGQDPTGASSSASACSLGSLSSEGRGAVTRAADQYLRAGFEFPLEQPRAAPAARASGRGAGTGRVETLRGIVVSEPPLKRPILEQRLKRLEDSAEEAETRAAATELRRVSETSESSWRAPLR